MIPVRENQQEAVMKEISIHDLQLNPFDLFGRDWLALTAGNETDGYNTMTIAWGQLGAIWGKEHDHGPMPTVVCYVRPSRYTRQFVDKEELFTLSRFPEQYRHALGYIGSHSGREENKIENAGLTPAFTDGTVTFQEADLVFVCRKIYAQDLQAESFMDKTLIDANYPLRDFHTMYIGEILKVYRQEQS